MAEGRGVLTGVCVGGTGVEEPAGFWVVEGEVGVVCSSVGAGPLVIMASTVLAAAVLAALIPSTVDTGVLLGRGKLQALRITAITRNTIKKVFSLAFTFSSCNKTC